MPAQQTAVPRVLTDAMTVLSNPDAYADRPGLIHLARVLAMSAAGLTPSQRHREPPRPLPILRAIRTAPALHIIAGGRA